MSTAITKDENWRPYAKPSPSTSKSRSPSRPADTKPPASPSPNAPGRSRTLKASAGAPLSARGSVRKATTSGSSDAGKLADDNARAETAALIDDLKSQLRKAEETSEEYQKEAYALQSRLDEALGEQTKLEDSSHESITRIATLENDQRENQKHVRDLTKKLDAEQKASTKEREQASAREEELGGIIQRLKESLSNRDQLMAPDGEGRPARAASFRGRSSPRPDGSPIGSPAPERRDSSQNNSALVLQKDKIIESLRLELAESQIRIMEVENAGGGRMRDLEKTLLETRMANAKLMEDNESYQVLLQEKTLNGDFRGGLLLAQAADTGASVETRGASLEDELSHITDDSESGDGTRKLENENAALKDQIRALTLYINNIITRLLQNDKFEALFESPENDETQQTPNKTADTAKAADTGKALPPPPGEEKETVAQTLLSRAGSVFGRNKPRPRPQSVQSSTILTGTSPSANPRDSLDGGSDRFTTAPRATPPPNPMENPHTAPSIPLKPQGARHTRAPSGGRSGPRSPDAPYASSIVNNMYRGPPSGTGQMSPSGLASPRQSPFFNSGPPPVFSEGANADESSSEAPDSRVASIDAASDSGYAESGANSKAASETYDAPSPPRSVGDGRSRGTGAIFSSGGGAGAGTSGGATNKMRPLRLVREKVEADEAAEAERKRANRQSFMGWFGLGGANAPAIQGQSNAPTSAVSVQESEEERARYGLSRPS